MEKVSSFRELPCLKEKVSSINTEITFRRKIDHEEELLLARIKARREEAERKKKSRERAGT